MVCMPTSAAKFVVTMHSKNMEETSENCKLSPLYNKIFVTKFGHIVAKIWIFEVYTVKFKKNKDFMDF